MIELQLRRAGYGLYTYDELSEERLAVIPNNGMISAMIHVPRNPTHNAMMHSLLKLVADNNTELPTPESLRRWLQLRTHMFETVLKRGEPIIVRQSLNFGDMDQVEFMEVFGAWTRVICEEVIPGMVPGDLMGEVLSRL